jgi:hypothetical protein
MIHGFKGRCPAIGRSGISIPNGIRTRVATVKGWSPRPLDHGDLERVTRIELALPTWKDGALPLCNTRLYSV